MNLLLSNDLLLKVLLFLDLLLKQCLLLQLLLLPNQLLLLKGLVLRLGFIKPDESLSEILDILTIRSSSGDIQLVVFLISICLVVFEVLEELIFENFGEETYSLVALSECLLLLLGLRLC